MTLNENVVSVFTTLLLSFCSQAYYNPLVLSVGMAAFLINPTNYFHRDARFWLLKVLGKIVLAPFFRVGFADFWLADQVSEIVFITRNIFVQSWKRLHGDMVSVLSFVSCSKEFILVTCCPGDKPFIFTTTSGGVSGLIINTHVNGCRKLFNHAQEYT